jgi:hypothetical protein
MSDRIVTLAVYSNAIEAQMARNRLVAEGIPAELNGDMGGAPLPGMETTFGSVQLLVPESEEERAAAVLGLAEEELPEEGLEDEDDPSRTAIREQQSGGLRPQHGEGPPPDTAIQTRASLQDPRSHAEDIDPPPAADRVGTGEEDQELEEKLNRRFTWTAEELASRALLTAVVGLMLSPITLLIHPVLVVLPLLVHAYSLWLVIRMALLPEDVSPAGMRKLCAALAIDLTVPAALGLFCLSVF